MKRRALFIDRDGILNEIVERDGGVHSPRSWEEVRHFDGLDELPSIKKLGFVLVMVTNQPDVERGIVPQSFLDELHGFYQEKYQLDAIYVCPYASEKHPLKKPNPGMFLNAAADLGLTLSQSFHLGDTSRDTIAAERCGCRSILWNRTYNQEVKADFRVSKFEDLVEILEMHKNLSGK